MSIPALRLNTEGPGASLPCLEREDPEFGRLPAEPIGPRRHDETERIGPPGSPEPNGLVPPALVRAQRRKAGASFLTSPYGPLPILVAVLTFITFEIWFLVPLPKGPLEDFLGY